METQTELQPTAPASGRQGPSNRESSQRRRIVVAFDTSEPSRAVLEAGRHLASQADATVSVLHVVDEPPTWIRAFIKPAPERDVLAAGRRRVFDAVRAMDEQGSLAAWLPEPQIRIGKPRHEIRRFADDWQAHAVVVGGRGHDETFDIGRVLRTLMTSQESSIWIQHGRFRAVRRILAPISLDRPDIQLAWARTLGEWLGASVRYVHVFQPPVQASVTGAAFAMTHLRKHVECALEEHSTRVLGKAGSIELLDGEPTNEILSEAHGVELVAMMTSAEEQLTPLMMGNVAYKVAHRAPVPVLLGRRRLWRGHGGLVGHEQGE